MRTMVQSMAAARARCRGTGDRCLAADDRLPPWCARCAASPEWPGEGPACLGLPARAEPGEPAASTPASRRSRAWEAASAGRRVRERRNRKESRWKPIFPETRNPAPRAPCRASGPRPACAPMAPADRCGRRPQLGGQRAVRARQSKLPGQCVARPAAAHAGTDVLPRDYANRSIRTSCFGKKTLTAPAT